MRLIELTDEQAVWLHGVMQNPLSEDPNPANEDPVDAANRRAVYEATAVCAHIGTRADTACATRSVESARDLLSTAQSNEDYGSCKYERLEAIDADLRSALRALKGD